MVKLNRQLDCIGILHLKQNFPMVKNFIVKAKNMHLSRNKIYYESKWLNDIYLLREQLLSYLGDNKLINYIVLDYVINFSAQVYYNLMSKKQPDFLVKQAKLCLEEDVSNMISLIENKNNYTFTQKLPNANLFIDFRNVELDNKLEVYSYVKNFGKIDCMIITPGLGSILIGPFFKAIWGNEFTNILYSRFKAHDNPNSKKCENFHKALYLVDDNVGSGFTTEELIGLLKGNRLLGVSSVEYDWHLYDIISRGQSPYTKFKYNKYDKLTIINTRNHKFLDKSVDFVVNNPENYIQYLKQHKFNSYWKNDITILVKIGKNAAKKYLPKQRYKDTSNFTRNIIKTYKGV